MKKIIFAIAFIIFTGSTALLAGNLRAYLSYATFTSPDGPYIETYLSIHANSVKFVKLENDRFQGTVNILMTFNQDNEIKAYKKYELKSPEVKDTSNMDFHFIDQHIAEVKSC